MSTFQIKIIIDRTRDCNFFNHSIGSVRKLASANLMDGMTFICHGPHRRKTMPSHSSILCWLSSRSHLICTKIKIAMLHEINAIVLLSGLSQKAHDISFSKPFNSNLLTDSVASVCELNLEWPLITNEKRRSVRN